MDDDENPRFMWRKLEIPVMTAFVMTLVFSILGQTVAHYAKQEIPAQLALLSRINASNTFDYAPIGSIKEKPCRQEMP